MISCFAAICHLVLEGRGFEHQRENCCILSEVLQNFFTSILYFSYFPSSLPSSVISSSIHPLYSLRICLFSYTVLFPVLFTFTLPLQLLFIPPLYSHLSLPVVHLMTLSVTEIFNGRMINKWNGLGINMYQTVLNHNNNNNKTETILTTSLFSEEFTVLLSFQGENAKRRHSLCISSGRVSTNEAHTLI